MITCGIDVGSLTAQAVLLQGDTIRAFESIRALPGPLESARAVTGAALAAGGLSAADLAFTVATGYGRTRVQEHGLAQANVSEISCHGAGARLLLPGVRTVIDIGGQDAKVIRLDRAGELSDFVMNDKCASGTGRFLEAMSRTLGVPLDRLGSLALAARAPVKLSARCSIFCETEVLHHMQRGLELADLAGGVTAAMAERVAALARRLGLEPAVTMTGGVAKNAGVGRALERLLGLRLTPCPVDPQLVGALGAARLAARLAARGDAG
jgi:predicted CoA-substrate-specific enzyme activase